MKKSRTILELLTLLRKEVRTSIEPMFPKCMEHSGLCSIIRHMWRKGTINADEEQMLDEYLYKHRPRGKQEGDYFWEMWYRKTRLNWIDKHIKLNTK